MPHSYHYHALTHAGRQRKHNEDSYGIFEVPNGLLMLVADGMGGHAGGQMASKLAVQGVSDYLKQKFYVDIRLAIQEAFEQANRLIINTASEDTNLLGMGSTLVVLLFDGKNIIYAHTGDSRLYHYSAQQLHLCTKDHSVIQELMDLGIISTADARYHPDAHKVTNVLGISNMRVSTATQTIQVASGDIFLLCSDGLTNMLPESKIQEILSNETTDLAQKNDQLVFNANQLGGTDNITVELLHIP